MKRHGLFHWFAATASKVPGKWRTMMDRCPKNTLIPVAHGLKAQIATSVGSPGICTGQKNYQVDALMSASV
jgi:hypothetical protein